MTTQHKRLLWRTAFFLLFIFAPVLDIFRYDLNEKHFILFQHPWVLGIDADTDVSVMLLNMFIRFFLPIAVIITVGIFISWKWGRLYCGWLCPHFSVVEMINSLMRRASGKPNLWEKNKLPTQQQDGTTINTSSWWWLITAIAVSFFAFLWAVALLTYLLPPAEIYGNLFTGELSRNQLIFITAATIVFILEFTLARHLFCRFGCAIGLFQSLIWMANKKALVVGFDRKRSQYCSDCDTSCEHACPMRLKPRSLKRNMFTCTQCMQCIASCEKVQAQHQRVSLLKMLDNECALDVSARGLGNKPDIPNDCFND